MKSFIRKLLSKFVKPAALQHRELHEVLFKEPSNQLPGNCPSFTSAYAHTRYPHNTLLEGCSHFITHIGPQWKQVPRTFCVILLAQMCDYTLCCLHFCLIEYSINYLCDGDT